MIDHSVLVERLMDRLLGQVDGLLRRGYTVKLVCALVGRGGGGKSWRWSGHGEGSQLDSLVAELGVQAVSFLKKEGCTMINVSWGVQGTASGRLSYTHDEEMEVRRVE